MSDALKGDRMLARRMLAGDEVAFDEFFGSHFPRLYRFAVARLGGDADAAEEAAQAALCKAVARLATYRGEAALFTWLCTICRHEMGRIQAERGRPAAVSSLAEDSEDSRAALESLAALEEGPEAALDRKEVARLVQVTLDNLPTNYASALEWKYIHGLPVKEIAERLQLGLKAAESLLTRARAAFRDGFSTLTGAPWRIRPSGGGSGRTGTS